MVQSTEYRFRTDRTEVTESMPGLRQRQVGFGLPTKCSPQYSCGLPYQGMPAGRIVLFRQCPCE
jgi:hypothetical protein